MTATHDPRSSRRIFRVDPRNGRNWLQIETKKTVSEPLVHALAESSKECMWIVPNSVTVARLLGAAQEVLRRQGQPKHRFGGLLALEPTKPSTAPILHGLFDPVIGLSSSFKHLPYDTLLEVLRSPEEVARDLLIGGWANAENELLILVRGNLQTLVVPFRMFEATQHARPDFRKLAFDDHGHTVRLGKYEASSDSILYDLDADYRRRLNAQRRETDRGFGPALRRLRKQRGLSRSDFPGLSEKTLARIERGEIERPHPRTIEALERKLEMTADEIASF